MHVTHIVAHPPFREGTGTVAYYNALALQELGCMVQVYSTRSAKTSGEEFQVPYHFMPSYLSIGNAYLTPDILSIKKTDILHLHYPFIFGSELTVLKSWSERLPVLLTYHSDLIGKGFRHAAFRIYNALNAPFVLRQASKIVVTSFDYAATSIFDRTVFTERKKDMVEIGNGVDIDSFRPDVDSEFIRLRHGFGKTDIIVLFVGSLDRSHVLKGLQFLIEGMADIPDPSIKLLIVGDGDMRLEYEQSVRRLELCQRVIFSGYVTQDELPSYYAGSDLICIPSRPPEAFGLALAQGMSAGKPVIGSDIPGVRALVTPECGFLIQPDDRRMLADRIQTLAADAALRVRFGRAGRERVIQNYTWRNAGRKLLALYQQVLSKQ